MAAFKRSDMPIEGDFFGSGLSYDANVWVQVYVPGFGIDSSGNPWVDAEGAGGETAKVLLNPAQEQILLLTGADAA